MKKKIIGVAVVAAIAVTAGWNYNQSQNEMAMSDLALANVEALAQTEGIPGYSEVYMSWEGGMGGGIVKVCTGSGSKIC